MQSLQSTTQHFGILQMRFDFSDGAQIKNHPQQSKTLLLVEKIM